jgi:anti-sigma factor RsiW
MLPLSEADAAIVADIVDGTRTGQEWDAWLAAHPEAAAEVAIARRVQALMRELAAASIVVPPGFEARVLERVRADSTLLDLLDLGLGALGRTVLELAAALFGILPSPAPTR